MNIVSNYTTEPSAITYSGFTIYGSSKLDNMLDSNYTNYTEFNCPNNVRCTLQMGSPTLESLGIPEKAVITQIVVTDVSDRYFNSYYTPSVNQFYISVGGQQYATSKYSSTSKNTYTSTASNIAIPRKLFSNDRAYYVFDWQYSYTASSYEVYSLHWEFTYEIDNTIYNVSVGDGVINKTCLGTTEVTAVYAGDVKIYG